ncbi:flagellar basal body rod protein FlgB [Methylophaga sp. OBS4]|uniref:flagellar basal body rod protein FlgB n=1 Tax=Methylophaga sp. OBS4 TaxID=2991935 RepID=UPI00225836C4|nr:flagellar basal body rod protein FlgB [Methylophaga sp. OBS4]MCX4187351.1 flagellar basal body rod protein FlgB [Methylophaga sp. OBS4]
MPITFDSALGIHADALRLRSQRAELLATNLANADTPEFKARDIDFKTALSMASAGQTSGHIQTTHQNHISTNAGGSDMMLTQAQYRVAVQDSLDGNTVDEQIEQAQFMQNAVQYQASLEFLGARFQGLSKAIKGE